ncbi:MAG: ATP-binding protein [Gammaproteobacteria bacterium]
MTQTGRLLTRLDTLLDRIKTSLPGSAMRLPDPIPSALRWHNSGREHYLETVVCGQTPTLHDLLCVDRQKQALLDNTRQFLNGYAANHVLLCGPRGTGKSSLVKSLIAEFGNEGLVVLEVSREHLSDLPLICRTVADLDKRFILFCDDLSFAADDNGYMDLKVMLDGSISNLPENMIIYATSNRRHLIPEYMSENTASTVVDGEIHLHESLEEKLSLSERFGVWLSFQPFSQEQYLQICRHWLQQLGTDDIDSEQTRQAALQWALERGSRSGRNAWQFAKDRAGKQRLRAGTPANAPASD